MRIGVTSGSCCAVDEGGMRGSWSRTAFRCRPGPAGTGAVPVTTAGPRSPSLSTRPACAPAGNTPALARVLGRFPRMGYSLVQENSPIMETRPTMFPERGTFLYKKMVSQEEAIVRLERGEVQLPPLTFSV